MKCANCGNANDSSLFDEGDTFYCANCTHRTLKSTGKDDLVMCPVCHNMRDRKAAYCRWCNDSTWNKNKRGRNKGRNSHFISSNTDSSDEQSDDNKALGLAISFATFIGLVVGKMGIELYKNHKKRKTLSSKKFKDENNRDV